MSIFDLRQSVIDEYSKYLQSFLSIAHELRMVICIFDL